MDRIKELVSGLIENTATAFSESDREWLGGLKECQLTKMAPDPPANPPVVTNAAVAPAVPDPAAAPAPNPGAPAPDPKPTGPITLVDFMASAPAELRPVLTGAMAQYDARKKALIAAIVAKNSDTFTAEELAAKDHGELERLAKLAGVDAPDRPPDYSGRGGSLTDGDDIPPPKPVWDLTKPPEKSLMPA